MKPTFLNLVLAASLLILALPDTAAGQTVRRAVRIVSIDDAAPQLVGPDGVQTIAGHADGVIVDVACEGVDCTQVTARLKRGDVTQLLDVEDERTTDTASFKVPGRQAGTITFRVDRDTVQPELTLTAAGTTTEESEEEDEEEVEFVQRREVFCAEAAELGGAYNRKANLAEMVVATDGFVISRPTAPMDENDDLVVYVMGSPDVLQTVRVVRTSATRAVGQSRRLGSEQMGGIRRQGAQDESTACGWARAELGDFEPGEGKFRITTGTGTQVSNADVTLRVNPLYHGAFSFGPVVSWLRDRSYTVLGDTTVAQSEGGSSDGHYVLSYTHFLLGPRDVEKGRRLYLNPMVGITLNKPLESVFGGVSLDFGGGDVFITAGAHGREVTRLDNREGVAVGRKLPAGLTSAPTQEVWRWAPFVGVQIDIRAAVDLFGKVLTGAGGGS